jgi:hypothetical protein
MAEVEAQSQHLLGGADGKDKMLSQNGYSLGSKPGTSQTQSRSIIHVSGMADSVRQKV